MERRALLMRGGWLLPPVRLRVEPYPNDMLVEMSVEAGRVLMIVTADRHPDPEMTSAQSLD